VVVASSFHFSTSLAIRFRLQEEIYGMPLVPFPLLERTKEKIDKNPTFYYSGVVSKEKKEMTRPFFFGLLRKSFQFFLLF
jgi:hypothetical protein